MADNITAPATGSILATDDIAGVHYPRTKISIGADGSASDVSGVNPLPVSVIGTVPVSGALTDTQLRATPLPVSGAVSVSGTVPVSGPLTDAQLRAIAVPVSLAGSVAVTGPLTDTQLRATPLPVSGSVGVTGAVTVTGPLTDVQLRATALALPVGAATEASLALLAPARLAFAITPHDTNAIATLPRAVIVGGAGNVALRAVDSGADVTIPVVAGQVLDIRVSHIRATGTTATGLVGLG